MELRDIQSCLRAGIESRATEVGPFLVLISTDTDNPFSIGGTASAHWSPGR